MIWLVATAAAAAPPAFCFNLFLLPSSPISPRLNHRSQFRDGLIQRPRASLPSEVAGSHNDGDRIMSTSDQTGVAPRSCMCTGRAGRLSRLGGVPLNLRRDADDDDADAAVAAAVVRLINEEESEQAGGRAGRIGG